MVITHIPCAHWGQNVISQELLPSFYPLSSGTCLVNTFTPAPSLGTVCFLFVVHSFFGHKLPPPISSVDNAGSCLRLSGFCFCLFPEAEELLYHSGTPGVLLENPSGCVFLPCSFLELSNMFVRNVLIFISYLEFSTRDRNRMSFGHVFFSLYHGIFCLFLHVSVWLPVNSPLSSHLICTLLSLIFFVFSPAVEILILYIYIYTALL